MARRLTDTEIAARIVPTMLRWPVEGKTIAWDRLRECVDALRGLVRTVDAHCIGAEQDQDLSSEGIARRRAEYGRQALTELATFNPFAVAEKATIQNIQYLEEKMTDLPKPPTGIADVTLAQEIRQYVRSGQSPIDAVVKSISDPRVLGAILNAPPFLSGLSETQFNLIRERARVTLHPEQTKMQEQLNKALAELREGVQATRRMLFERCDIKGDENGSSGRSKKPLTPARPQSGPTSGTTQLLDGSSLPSSAE